MSGNDALCVLPWLHLNCNPDGYVTLCCQSGTWLLDDRGRPLNLQTHSLREIWFSQAMRDIRRAMLAGEKLPHCKGCYQNEHFGWGSARLALNEQWLGTAQDAAAPDARKLDVNALGEETGPPRSFDLRIGNVCNLRCVNCRSMYSSQIERDPVHSLWSDTPFVRLAHRFGDTGEWYKSKTLLAEIIDIGRDALDIQLAGGEPSINPLLLSWLESLCEEGRAGQIDIGLVTNLTNVSARLQAILSKFRQVTLKISLDGFGQAYEYVRFPGKWQEIEKNIDRIRDLPNLQQAIVFPVLNIYNFLSITELLEWAEARSLPVVATLVRSVDHVDGRLLPPPARAEARRRLDAFFAAHTRDGVLSPRLADLAHQIDVAFKEIEATDYDAEARQRHLAAFMQFTNDMDVSRGTSFAATFPETLAFLTEAYGPWRPELRYGGPSFNDPAGADRRPASDWREWAETWSGERLLPIDRGFADAILGAGARTIETGARQIAADWRNGRRERAVGQLAGLFDAFVPAGVAWFTEHTIDMASADGMLRVRYFLFRLLIDIIRQHDPVAGDAAGAAGVAGLIEAYLEQVPRSRGARLVLAELSAEAGDQDAAVAMVKAVLAEHSVLLLPQQVLAALYRRRHDPAQEPMVDGVYIGDLSDRFCHVPFDELMTDSAGAAWTCCPSFLPVPIGYIERTPWHEIWRSKAARTLRRSVLDGDFRYCSRTQCPAILAGSLPRKADIAEPRLRRLIDAGPNDHAGSDSDVDETGPHKVYFCHDAACNLVCPQCRVEMYKTTPARAAQLNRLLETLVEPILDYAAAAPCTILLSGNGDPFYSQHYLEILKRFDPARHQTVSLHLITNGLLFRQGWERFPNIHPLLARGYVGFSLDGASAEVYRQTRGASWTKALENLEFLAALRRTGKVAQAGINYAVQTCNFKDMSVIAELAARLGLDAVGFNQLRNEGTFTPDDYRTRTVFEPEHPRYQEFLEELRHPALKHPIVSFGSLTPHVEIARATG